MKSYTRVLGAGLLTLWIGSSAWAALIGSDFNGNLYDVNLITGAATNLRATGISNLAGIAFDAGGVLYGLSTQFDHASLYRINPTTGASTLIGSSSVLNPFTDNFSEGDLRFDPANGTLFGIDYVSVPASTPVHQIFTINTTTGATTNVANLPCFNNSCVVDYSALAADASGRLYLLDTASLDPFGHLVVATGSPFSPVSNVLLSAPLGAYAGMDFDPVSGTLYVADGGTGGGSLRTLNPTTGMLTTVGNLGISNGLSGLAFSPVTTPEPGTLSLLGFGALSAFALCSLVRMN